MRFRLPTDSCRATTVRECSALSRRKKVHRPTFGHSNPILAELAIERVAGNAEQSGGLGAIAAGNSQRLLDGKPLHLFHGARVAEVELPGRAGVTAHQHGLEIFIGDGLGIVPDKDLKPTSSWMAARPR